MHTTCVLSKSLNVCAQLSSGGRGLNASISLHPCPFFLHGVSEYFGETAHLYRLICLHFLQRSQVPKSHELARLNTPLFMGDIEDLTLGVISYEMN